MKIRSGPVAILVLAVVPLLSACFGGEPPRENFAKYHGAYRAGDVEEMKKFSSAANRSRMEQFSISPQLLDAMRMAMPEKYTVESESIEGERATLAIQGSSAAGMMVGTIGMVKEDGSWKIDRMEWRPAGA